MKPVKQLNQWQRQKCMVLINFKLLSPQIGRKAKNRIYLSMSFSLIIRKSHSKQISNKKPRQSSFRSKDFRIPKSKITSNQATAKGIHHKTDIHQEE